MADGPPELTIQCRPQWLWKFNILLQKGIRVKCLVNRSLMALFKEDFQLDNTYIRQRIQTITLNSRPVDDPSRAMVFEGAVLAISGALPGLAGATLRKESCYAAMRSTVTYTGYGATTAKARPGLITVKLFNLILKDQAAAFLSRGIGSSGQALASVLDDLIAQPDNPMGRLELNGQPLKWPKWRDHCSEQPLVFVQILATAPLE